MTKKKREQIQSEVQLASVITPMLDMTFQLLFFLIFTFKPSNLQEGKVEFNLPAAGEAKAQRPEDIDPSKINDSELALPAQLTVLVKTVRDGVNDGNISALIVKSADGETALPNLDALERYLKNKQGELTNKAEIKIEGESKLKYLCMVDVMDACLRAGFSQVSFPPPPDLTMQN